MDDDQVARISGQKENSHTPICSKSIWSDEGKCSLDFFLFQLHGGSLHVREEESQLSADEQSLRICTLNFYKTVQNKYITVP